MVDLLPPLQVLLKAKRFNCALTVHLIYLSHLLAKLLSDTEGNFQLYYMLIFPDSISSVPHYVFFSFFDVYLFVLSSL